MNKRQRIHRFINDKYPKLLDPFGIPQHKYSINQYVDLFGNTKKFTEYFDVFNVRKHLISYKNNTLQ